MDWTQIPNIAEYVGQFFVKLFTILSQIFYTPASGTGADAVAGGFTFIGQITLTSLFVGLCILLVNWIRSLIVRR